MENRKHTEYNEKKQRGSLDFPIQLYCVNKDHRDYIMPLHWHNELEIIKVVYGTLDLYINNVPYTLRQGDIAIINCKFLHRAIPNDCKYECTVFDMELINRRNGTIYTEFIHPIVSGNLIINCIYHQDKSKLYLALNSIFLLLKAEAPYHKLGVISNLFTVFEQLYYNDYIYPDTISKKHYNQNYIISKLLEWIQNNYTEHITLETLSEKAGITPNYLCRLFKSYTEKTPIEYINYLRIQNICHEIKWSEKTITEIALENGFNDTSYFCKVFKKQMGISAKTYSKQLRNDFL